MDDNRISILNSSVRMLSKLQVLSVFFGDELVYKIYMRTQVIHQLFEDNDGLDINKLELFHLQYSSALIELLKKVKKNNEQSVSLLQDEVDLNNDLIGQIQSPVFTKQNFELDKQRQSLKISTSLKRLYEVLSDNSAEYPLARNLNTFSTRFSRDFFYTVSPDVMNGLDAFESKDVYSNAYAMIQRRLMGTLCKYDFRIGFYCGLKAGEQVAEVYKFLDVDKYLIFFPSRVIFLFCDMARLRDLDRTTELEKREEFILELKDKNEHLSNTISAVRTTIPPQIKTLLAEHYKKLSDMNFLQDISKIDVQANILKSMLNTDMM